MEWTIILRSCRSITAVAPLPENRVNQPTASTHRLASLSAPAPELASTVAALAGDIAMVVDADGVVRNVSTQEAGLSASADAWVGRPWAETVTTDTRRKIENLLDEVRQEGRSRRREVNHPSALGQDIPVAWAAVRLGDGGPVLAVGRDLRVVAAIQQRFLESQQELERDYWKRRQTEARYRLLFQVATDAVLVLDAQTYRVVEANQAATHLLGENATHPLAPPCGVLGACASLRAEARCVVAPFQPAP